MSNQPALANLVNAMANAKERKVNNAQNRLTIRITSNEQSILFIDEQLNKKK